MSRTTPSQPRGDRPQQLVAGAVAERVVDALEVVEVDEQRRDRRLAATRARQHLLDAVEDQRAVGQARQRVVGGQERELVLAASELLVGALALCLEGLAHPHERDVEAALQHAQSPARAPRRERPSCAAVSRSTSSAASRQRRQRLVTSFSGAARWAASWPKIRHDSWPDLARDLRALAGHPAGDRDRGDRADPREAVFDDLVEHLARLRGAAMHPRDHIVGARVQRFAEAAQLLAISSRARDSSRAPAPDGGARRDPPFD